MSSKLDENMLSLRFAILFLGFFCLVHCFASLLVSPGKCSSRKDTPCASSSSVVRRGAAGGSSTSGGAGASDPLREPKSMDSSRASEPLRCRITSAKVKFKCKSLGGVQKNPKNNLPVFELILLCFHIEVS